MSYDTIFKGQTRRFFVTLGLWPGYSTTALDLLDDAEDVVGDPGSVDVVVARVAEMWRVAAASVVDVYGVSPSAVVQGARVAYATEHGCPRFGEQIVTLVGTFNPAFGTDIEAWRAAVLDIVEQLAADLGQVTVQANFDDVEIVYLRQSAPVDAVGRVASEL